MPTEPTIDEVKALAIPKNSWSDLDAQITINIDIAARLYYAVKEADGPDYTMLVRLHAAHFTYCDEQEAQNDGNGPTTSQSAGEVSQGFGSADKAQVGSDDLSRSPLGAKLRQLRIANGTFMGTSGGPPKSWRGQ